MGWERKRGKLEVLVRLLAGEDVAPFASLGALSTPRPDTRYVLTLDSDTVTGPRAVRELVAIAAHPLNAAIRGAHGRRIAAGYGILQPRVVPPLPTASERTPYHWLFAGQCGIDPYSATTSEIYQDLFGIGSFTGKGLLDVAVMHDTLDRRVPDNTLLSHDLFEGSIARCGFVSDVLLMEEAPSHAEVAAERLHRWTRGDWQLLPFLFGARRYDLDALAQWKIVDNLRRSLIAPASLAVLCIAFVTGAPPVRPCIRRRAGRVRHRPGAGCAGGPFAQPRRPRAAALPAPRVARPCPRSRGGAVAMRDARLPGVADGRRDRPHVGAPRAAPPAVAMDDGGAGAGHRWHAASLLRAPTQHRDDRRRRDCRAADRAGHRPPCGGDRALRGARRIGLVGMAREPAALR